MLALLRLLFVSALLFAALLPGAQAVPPGYTLHVLAVADTRPSEFVWIKMIFPRLSSSAAAKAFVLKMTFRFYEVGSSEPCA